MMLFKFYGEMLLNISLKICKTNAHLWSNKGAKRDHTTQHIQYNYRNYTYIHTLGVYQVKVSTMPLLQAHIIH